MTTLYDALGGAEAVLALAHAWHERVLADPVVSHAFSHGFRDDHTERLAAYWAEVLGGPADVLADHGRRVARAPAAHRQRAARRDGPAGAWTASPPRSQDVGVPEAHHESLVGWFRDANQYVNHHFASPDAVPAGVADAGRGGQLASSDPFGRSWTRNRLQIGSLDANPTQPRTRSPVPDRRGEQLGDALAAGSS